MKDKGFPVLVIAAAVILVLWPSGAPAASRDALSRIAGDSPVSGWSAMADATTYVQGDGLSEIYDGGYEAYTRAGVVDALRRLYERDGEYVEVTVHGMKSPRSAKEFLADRYGMETGKEPPAAADWDRFTASRPGGTTAYVIAGPYFITIVSYTGGEEGKARTAEFLKALDSKAEKLLEEPK